MADYRHRVVVRSAEVFLSNWDAQLETIAKGSQPAVCLGLNNIKDSNKRRPGALKMQGNSTI